MNYVAIYHLGINTFHYICKTVQFKKINFVNMPTAIYEAPEDKEASKMSLCLHNVMKPFWQPDINVTISEILMCLEDDRLANL